MGRGIQRQIFTTIWLEARWRTVVMLNGYPSSAMIGQKPVIE